MLPVMSKCYHVYLKSEFLGYLGFETLILLKVVAKGSKYSHKASWDIKIKLGKIFQMTASEIQL